MNSTTQTIYVQGALTPSQRDTILAATKWIERICDRKEMLPASFMDNADPSPIAKKLRASLDSENASGETRQQPSAIPPTPQSP